MIFFAALRHAMRAALFHHYYHESEHRYDAILSFMPQLSPPLYLPLSPIFILLYVARQPPTLLSACLLFFCCALDDAAHEL